MARKETPWKLDRPYDPDQRADALRQRFSRYLGANGVRTRSGRMRIWLVWLAIAVAAGVLFAYAA